MSFKDSQLSTLTVGDTTFDYVNIADLPGIEHLPYSLKVLVENLVRNIDGKNITDEHVKALLDWDPQAEPSHEIQFTPSRVVMQDFTGVPCIVDLATMRDAVKELGGDPEAWMEQYVRHNLQILDEPISILANPTYLPAPLNAMADKLWTEARMRAIIAKAVAKGVAIEIQAESPYPRPRFLKLAREMGAKFSFGTNNFDPRPKDLSRWLEAITWLDLHGEDIWTPACLKR